MRPSNDVSKSEDKTKNEVDRTGHISASAGASMLWAGCKRRCFSHQVDLTKGMIEEVSSVASKSSY